MTDLIAVQRIAGWEKLKTLVLDSVSSPITKRVYNMALDEFMRWFQRGHYLLCGGDINPLRQVLLRIRERKRFLRRIGRKQNGGEQQDEELHVTSVPGRNPRQIPVPASPGISNGWPILITSSRVLYDFFRAFSIFSERGSGTIWHSPSKND